MCFGEVDSVVELFYLSLYSIKNWYELIRRWSQTRRRHIEGLPTKAELWPLGFHHNHDCKQ